MNLKTEIEHENHVGNIKPPFRAEDLLHCPDGPDLFKIGRTTYKKHSIITNLNNMSVGPEETKGNHVKNGREPWSLKNEDGYFCKF
jgi:hypothetical protein